MTGLAASLILVTTLITSFISGIFGMAGGLILMAVLVSLVSIAMAMVIHGSIQMVANGYRAYLLRTYIRWSIVGYFAIGAALGVCLLLCVSWSPDKRTLYLLLGLTPLLVWVPRHYLHLDIVRPGQAIFAGCMVQGLNTLAGVAGPLLDLFFVRTDLARQDIVATKSITQAISHAVKTGFWGLPILHALGWQALPPVWLLALALPLCQLGTRLGKTVLMRMSESGFRKAMKWLVTAIGGVLLLRAAGMY